MTLQPITLVFWGPRRAARQDGFTLPELLMASTLCALLLAGTLAANLFGMRMLQFTQTKLNASDGARKALGQLADEIRMCKATYVGDVTNGTFAARLNGELQTGSGLLVQRTTNTSDFIVYYLEPSDKTFRRTTSMPAHTRVLAQSVTNTTLFSTEDFRGSVLTNSQNNRVIHVSLEFFQQQPQLATPDYYKLETSVTRRMLQ